MTHHRVLPLSTDGVTNIKSSLAWLNNPVLFAETTATRGRLFVHRSIVFALDMIQRSPPDHKQNSSIGPGNASVSRGQLIAVLVFGGACLGFHWLSSAAWVPILDSANLALHEAGHPLMGIFSQRASVYGGTAFQLALPIMAAWHSQRVANSAGMAASLVWLGENLLNISRYMADARAQELPLVGGGEHDWTEIFSRWGVLYLDTRIASMTRGIGFLLVIGTMLWLYGRWRGGREVRNDVDSTEDNHN